MGHELRLDRFSALFGEVHVVVVGTLRVGVPFDRDHGIAIALRQRIGDFVQSNERGRKQCRLVARKEDRSRQRDDRAAAVLFDGGYLLKISHRERGLSVGVHFGS